MAEDPSDLARSYDDVPYVSRPFWYTHPDTLGTVATLAGMSPAPVEKCRVLELGCASGGNLLPMAEALPNSRFVGIDLSPVQIEYAQRIASTLTLRNLQFETLSILDLPEDFGTFDYIIAHGVYSWVPPDVQRAILKLCRKHLAQQGVAYISYNTYPGWHLRQSIREMMRYHVDGIEDPEERIAQAGALLEFLQAGAPTQYGIYQSLLSDEAKRLAMGGPYYLLHEHLDPYNEPLYFHQFISRLRDEQLQYIGEARQVATPLSSEAQATLASLNADPVRAEQYLDFISNRMFRWSLLTHADTAMNNETVGGRLAKLRVAAPMKLKDGQSVSGNEEVEFKALDGRAIVTRGAAMKRTLAALGNAWPRSLTIERLKEEAEDPTANAEVEGLIVRGYLQGAIELHLHEFDFQTQLSDRPAISPLARLAAASGLPVPNRRHTTLQFSEFDRLVLPRLDGKHDRSALVAALMEDVKLGRIDVSGPDGTLPPIDALHAFLAQSLEKLLVSLTSGAILIS